MVESSQSEVSIFCCKTKQFLCASQHKPEQRYIANAWEKFEIENLGDNLIAIKSCHGKYLSA